ALIGQGDVEARDRMVRVNLRLVVNIARSYIGKGLNLQDLIAEGNLGLLRAVEGFDPYMNTRFSTYASFWIKQSIKRALVNTAKTDPRAATVLRLRFGLDDDEPKSLREIGERIGLTRERVRQIEGEALRQLSESLHGE